MLRDPDLTLATWQEPRHLVWSYQHMRELVPTARIARSPNPRGLLTLEGGEDLLALAVEADGLRTTVAAVLDSGSTDGFLVLHDGRVALEFYDGMAPDATHLLQSVSKSITGVLTGILVERGMLNPEDEVGLHIPELAGTSFAGATVRHLLDMRAGTRFDETYEDPGSDIRESEMQFGWAPCPDGSPAPDALTYLARLGNQREHGGRFEYRSILTDVLGHVLERAAGAPLNDLLGRHLWGPLGAACDAEVTVDGRGFPVSDGGICVTLRDLGRFAQMVLDNGMVEDRAIVPAAWIADTVRGGPDSATAFAADEHSADFPGGHYRNQWWVPGDGSTLIGLGIHGQFVYVDWATRTAGVKLSTWPTPLDDHERVMTIAAFRAIAGHLAQSSVG
ncbi:MAG TPA: serine hydrolase [Solirubrobacteraceae bacterium]|nr:serine hydrolase [Solirubrobacteraceae bacterium]